MVSCKLSKLRGERRKLVKYGVMWSIHFRSDFTLNFHRLKLLYGNIGRVSFVQYETFRKTKLWFIMQLSYVEI